jgi:hypothetical protein
MRSFVSIVAAGVFAASASAGSVSVVFSQSYDDWSDPDFVSALYPAGWTTSVVNDDFSTMQSGTFATASGGSAWNAWTMNPSSGSLAVNTPVAGIQATETGATIHIAFTSPGSPDSGLHGVGGYFGLRDGTGNWVPGTIQVTLSNGSSDVRRHDSASQFIGWWISTPGLTITSLDIRPVSNFKGSFTTGNTVAISQLSFGYAGVPAPGAFALLGLAGLMAGRGRRA